MIADFPRVYHREKTFGSTMNQLFYRCTHAVGLSLALLAHLAEPVWAGNCVYVGLAGTEERLEGLAVVDAQSGSVADFIQVPNGIGGTIAVDPIRLRAYLAGYAILSADMKTNTIVDTIPWPRGLSGHPQQMTLSPDGTRLYVLIASKLLVIDPIARTLMVPPLDLPTSSGTPFLDITPDGRYLYVARPPFGISIVDTESFSITGEVAGYPPGAFAYSVRVSPNGMEAFSLDPENMISVIDTSTRSISHRMKVTDCRRVNDIDQNCGSSSLTISRDGRDLYVVNSIDSSIESLSTSNYSELLSIPLYSLSLPDFAQPHPVSVAVSADGSTLAVTHSGLDADSSPPDFIWLYQGSSPVRVSISDSLVPSISSMAVAIASIPSGCFGSSASPSPSLTPAATPTGSPTRTAPQVSSNGCGIISQSRLGIDDGLLIPILFSVSRRLRRFGSNILRSFERPPRAMPFSDRRSVRRRAPEAI